MIRWPDAASAGRRMALLVLGALVWEAAARSGAFSPLVVPSIARIGRELWWLVIRPESLADAWFSLQRSIDEEEIAGVPAARSLHRLPAREDFDGMAALVAELDLIVSIDTSIVHLGGALGRPTWMMLATATDWRWHTSRADTPWYPTLRLFRQPRAGDWNAVVQDVAAELARCS